MQQSQLTILIQMVMCNQSTWFNLKCGLLHLQAVCYGSRKHYLIVPFNVRYMSMKRQIFSYRKQRDIQEVAKYIFLCHCSSAPCFFFVTVSLDPLLHVY